MNEDKISMLERYGVDLTTKEYITSYFDSFDTRKKCFTGW